VTPAVMGPESSNLILNHTLSRSNLEKLGSTPTTCGPFDFFFLEKD
jgi:hypothetical protein